LIEGLAEHYSAFRVSERLFLTGHSHQAWPDVAREGQLEAWEDAAEHTDLKWERAFAKAERLREGVRKLLADPAAPVALASNTHELVLRFLSALPLRERPKLVTTDGEFHTLRRQRGRLSEEGLEVARLPTRPVETLSERVADKAPDASAVLVSAVLFEDSRIVPGLPALAAACADAGAELLVDAYHALGCLTFTVAGLEGAWIVGGGYKYLQLGEGNCFLRLPPSADELRPAITGWFAEFEDLHEAHEPGATEYPSGSMRFAGSTYDPTSHYRAARVLDFFEEQSLTPQRLRDSYLRQTTLLAERFDELGLDDVTRDRDAPLSDFGGFLALESERAEELSRRLLEAGVVTDSRGRYLRLGPAPYHSDEQLEAAVEHLGRIAR
jgi:kynureninase